MLAGITHLPCKGVYFPLYTCGEMGCELEISRAEGLDFCFCLSGNDFSFFFPFSSLFLFFKCNHLFNSIPPLQDNGQFSGDPGCWFCLKSERAENLLTWLGLPMKTSYLTGFKYCALEHSSQEAAGELGSLPASSTNGRRQPSPGLKGWIGRFLSWAFFFFLSQGLM